jgi:hypothetical protein
VAAAPVLDKVAQFSGVVEKASCTRPEVMVTRLLDVSHPESLPLRCACFPPLDADMRGENEMVPESWHVTDPGAAPRYRCVLAAAGPAETPNVAATTATAMTNTIGVSGLRRTMTLSVPTVTLRPGPC